MSNPNQYTHARTSKQIAKAEGKWHVTMRNCYFKEKFEEKQKKNTMRKKMECLKNTKEKK